MGDTYKRSVAPHSRDIAQPVMYTGCALVCFHCYVAPDLFTAETPLGTYQGMTDQVLMSRTPEAFNTVLVPRGSSRPAWLGA